MTEFEGFGDEIRERLHGLNSFSIK
jgi:hypothetical protein